MADYKSVGELRNALKREFPVIAGFSIRAVDFTDLARAQPYCVTARDWGGFFGEVKAFLADARIVNANGTASIFASAC